MTLAALTRELRQMARAVATRPTAEARRTLDRLRADPAAVLPLAGYDREPHQEAFLRSGAAREILLTTRQFGKSTVCAARCVTEILLRPGSLALVVSPSLRQSGEL